MMLEVLVPYESKGGYVPWKAVPASANLRNADASAAGVVCVSLMCGDGATVWVFNPSSDTSTWYANVFTPPNIHNVSLTT
jgi:hypothetical protein